MKRLFSFTLAEILIVVGIIGLIAELTIPTLMQNVQDAQMKSALKVAYSLLSPSITQATTDNGGSIAGVCENFDNVCFKNLLRPYLKYVKDCDSAVVTNGCWKTEQYMDGTLYNSAEITFTDNSSGGPSALILANGMLVMFRYHYKDCTYTDSSSSNNKCGWIEVDVNGVKKPNQVGKDTFVFHVQDGLIKPGGIFGDVGNYLTCDSTSIGMGSGLGCTYKFLYSQ